MFLYMHHTSSKLCAKNHDNKNSGALIITCNFIDPHAGIKARLLSWQLDAGLF